MALSQVLELTSGPAIVPQIGYTSPLTSTVNAMRGSLPVAIQVASGGIPTALPTGAVLFYGVKQSTALKGDWLANCQLAASTDPGLPGWWTGTLLLNTPEMRAAMHAELDDPVAELPVLDCLAEIYYTIPDQTDPVFSLNFDFAVGAPLYNGTEGMAPSPNQPYPPPSTLNDAVGKANSALQPGNEDTYCFFCQGSSVGSYFYVEGATAYLASAQQAQSLVAGFLVVVLGARGLTRISCVSLNVLDFGTLPAGLTFLDANPSFLTTAAQDSVLAQLVANGKPNGGLYLSGQGAGPSAAGHANALILQARGWFVAANF